MLANDQHRLFTNSPGHGHWRANPLQGGLRTVGPDEFHVQNAAGVGVIGAIDEELRSQVLGRVTDERSGWQTVGRS